MYFKKISQETLQTESQLDNDKFFPITKDDVQEDVNNRIHNTNQNEQAEASANNSEQEDKSEKSDINQSQDLQQEVNESLNSSFTDTDSEYSEQQEGTQEEPVHNATNNQRPKRTRKMPAKFDDYVLYIIHDIQESKPKSYTEAINSNNSSSWTEAIQQEIRSMYAKNVWEATKLPENKKAIDLEWVSKVKRKVDGSIDRFKA